MIRRGNVLWEGLSTEPKPTIAQGAGDGQFLKELDTGDTYEWQAGAWINISAGLSFIKASKSGLVTTNSSGLANVTFTTPLISDYYSVALSHQDLGNRPIVVSFSNLSTTGFTVHSRDARSNIMVPNVVVSWLATRDYNP